MNAERKIKNKNAVITGAIGGAVTLLFVVESFQVLLAFLFGAHPVALKFKYISLLAVYNLNETSSVPSVIVTIAPILILIGIIEISFQLQKKTGIGYYRYSLMLFQLILVGYLLIFVFYEALTVILREFMHSDFVILFNRLNLETPIEYIVLFMIILITAAYINLHARRIGRYINK